MTWQDFIHQYFYISAPHSKEWCDKSRGAHNSNTGQCNTTGLENTGNHNTGTQAQRPSCLFKFQFFHDLLLVPPPEDFRSTSYSSKCTGTFMMYSWRDINYAWRDGTFLQHHLPLTSPVQSAPPSKYTTGPVKPKNNKPGRNLGDFSQVQL